MIKSLPDGSGMRELREWLKSLRLHKYTKILLEVNYEELLTLTDETLEKKNVTMGARGKILKYIGHIKERPQTLKYVSKALTVGSIMNDLNSQLFVYNYLSICLQFVNCLFTFIGSVQKQR